MNKINLKLTKNHYLAIAVALALVIGAAAIFIFRHNDIKKREQLTVCSEAIIKRASTALKGNKPEELQVLESEIKALKSYEKDQNCLFIAIQSAMSNGDLEATSDYLRKLKPIYKDQSYSKAFTVSTMSYKEMNDLAQSLRQDAAKADKVEADRMKEDSEVLNKVDEVVQGQNQ